MLRPTMQNVTMMAVIVVDMIVMVLTVHAIIRVIYSGVLQRKLLDEREFLFAYVLIFSPQ